MNAEESIDFAKKYLEDIVSFFGVNVVVEATREEDVIELSVPSTDINSVLIGRNAETLRSLQYTISTTLRNKNAELTRVNVDVADYKKQHAEKVAADARVWIEEVRRTGDSHIADLNAA
ncbi:MAG: KH domain-containing protein, partial [Candidatus Saccharibacteria bacterium]